MPRPNRLPQVSLVLYVVCLIGLISAYFVISGMEIPYAVYLQGPRTFEPGQVHTFRGRVINAKNNLTVRRVESVQIRLEQGGEVTAVLGDPVIKGDGKFTLQATLPDSIEPGAYDLVFDAKIVASDPAFVTSAGVSVTKGESRVEVLGSVSRYPDEVRKLRKGVYEGEGDVEISVVPAHGEVSRGLADRVFVVTSKRETGEPLACDVVFEKREGFVDRPVPERIKTNKLGVGAVVVAARGTLQWEMKATCAPEVSDSLGLQGQTKAQWLTVPSQVSLRVHKPVVSEGGKIEASVGSIYKKRIVYADLHDDSGRWLWSGSFGVRGRQGGVRIPLPLGVKGGVKVQVSHEFFALEHSWDVKSFEVAKSIDAGLEQALRVPERIEGGVKWGEYLRDHPEHWQGMTPKEKRGLLKVLLRARPIAPRDPKVVIDSAAKDRAALEEWKQGVRRPLLGLIGLAMLLGLLGLLVIVVRGVKHVKARDSLYDEVALEMDEVGVSEEVGAKSGGMFWMQMVVMFGTLVLFAGFLLFLLMLL